LQQGDIQNFRGFSFSAMGNLAVKDFSDVEGLRDRCPLDKSKFQMKTPCKSQKLHRLFRLRQSRLFVSL